MRFALSTMAMGLALTSIAPLAWCTPAAGVDYAALVEQNGATVVFVEVKKTAESKG